MARGAALILLVVAGCSRGAAAPDAGPQAFIALDRDFAAYRSWPHFRLEGGGQYPRTVYLSRARVPGSGEFAVGTILVKELERPADGGGLEVDAMVKRGAGFNAGDGGAPGWEFFGLLRTDAGLTAVQWRGTGTGLATGSYGGGGASCVGCHAAAQGNDFVQSPPLRAQQSPHEAGR